MKIPLLVRTHYGKPACFASVSVIKQRLRPSKLLALVDSGSPWTVITPSGVKLLKISIKSLPLASQYPTIWFAGYTFQRFLLKNVNIYIMDENKKPQCFNMSEISVLEPTKKVDLTRFPEQMLIGCDFLYIHNMSLFFHPKKSIAYFK